MRNAKLSPYVRVHIAFQHRYSPVNLLRIFRTPFSKNTSGRLLLIFFDYDKLGPLDFNLAIA